MLTCVGVSEFTDLSVLKFVADNNDRIALRCYLSTKMVILSKMYQFEQFEMYSRGTKHNY